MIQCKRCGEILNGDEGFCKLCGTSISDSSPEEPVVYEVSESRPLGTKKTEEAIILNTSNEEIIDSPNPPKYKFKIKA